MKPGTRRTLLTIHRWLGVHIGLLLFVICFTGTLAVLGYEWDQLMDPAFRAETTGMNWEAVERSLAAELPHHRVETLSAPRSDGSPAIAFVSSPRDQYMLALFEPADGRLIATRSLLTIQFFLRQYHKSLIFPYGLYVVGLLGAVLLFAAISGLLIYPQWWRHLFRLRLNKSANLRWTDIHRTVGVWVSLFAVLISVTGFWYWIEQAAHDAVDAHFSEEAPHLSEGRLRDLDAVGFVPASRAVEAARDHLPALDVGSVVWPHGPDHPYEVVGQADAMLVRDWANRVWVDPYDASVIGGHTAGELPALSRWTEMVDPLHFGTLGKWESLGWKLVYFVGGLLISLATLAGSILAVVRASAGRGRGRRRWFNYLPLGFSLLFLLASIVFSYLGTINPSLAGEGAPESISALHEVDGTRFAVARQTRGENAVYTLHWVDGPPVTIERVELLLGDAEPTAMRGWARPRGWGPDAEELTVRLVGHDARTTDVALRFEGDASVADTVGLSADPLSIAGYPLTFTIGMLVLVFCGSVWWVAALWRLPSTPKAARRSTVSADSDS